MRNKLVFPEGGLETKYLWDRYSLQNEGIHKWDRYGVKKETTYTWNKHKVNSEKRVWKKYSLADKNIYQWHRYPVTTTTDLVENHWEQDQEVNDYINVVFDGTFKWDDYEYHFATSGYIVLFGVDDEGNHYKKILDVVELYDKDISMWGLAYSKIWYGATYCETYEEALEEDTPTIIGIIELMRGSWASTGESGYFLMGDGILRGNFSYAYRGEPVSSIENQYTYEMTERKKLTKQVVYGPTDVVEYQFRGKYNGIIEIQNSKYLSVNNDTNGYLVDFNNYTLLENERKTAYRNDLVLGPNYGGVSYFTEYQGVRIAKIKGSYIEDVIGESGTYPDNGQQGDFWYELQPLDSYHYWDKYSVKITNANYKYKKYGTFPMRWKATPVSQQLYLEYTANEPFQVYNTNVSASFLEMPVINGEFVVIKEDEPIRVFRADMSYVDMSGVEFVDTYMNRPPLGSDMVVDRATLFEKGFVGISPQYSLEYFQDRPQFFFTNDSRAEVYYSSDSQYSWIYNKGIHGKMTHFYDWLGDIDLPMELRTGYQNYKDASLWGVTTTQTNSGSRYLALPNAVVPNYNSSNIKLVYGYSGDYPHNELHTDGWYYRLDDTYDGTEVDFNSYEIVEADNNTTYPESGFLNGFYYEYLEHSVSQERGDLLNGVISKNQNEYPSNGIKNGYYYIKRNTDTVYQWSKLNKENGYLIETLLSWKEDTYPTNATQDGYYYQRESDMPVETMVEQGEFIEVITSQTNAYPSNGILGGFWYVLTNIETSIQVLDRIQTVQDASKTTYPYDGLMGNYWYKYLGYENQGPYKSYKVDEIETNNRYAYPTDGIEGNYWYVYRETYQGYKMVINESKLRGGVTYQQCINPEEDFTIGCVASAQVSFDYDNRGDDFHLYQEYNYFDYYTWQSIDNDWRLIGRFYWDEIKHNKKLIKCKAFDSLGMKAENYVDSFISSTSYPVRVIDFYRSLCSYLGLQSDVNYNLVNLYYTFNDNFEAINITARQLFQYIAEVTGGYIKATPNDRIILTKYEYYNHNLTNSQYTKATVANYEVDEIEGVTVKANTDDLGVSAGDEEGNIYVIENNPLLYTDEPSDIQTEVNNLYVVLGDISYTPAEVELLTDYNIDCGQIITLNGKDFYVMDKEIKASGCKLKCLGNKSRAKATSNINSDIVALRGKTNELYRDLETTRSTLTDRTNGLQSKLTQTANEINARVTNAMDGFESEISQNAEAINLRVTNEVAGLESKITQTANSITSTVTDEINQAKSEIKQTTDSISLQVQNQGDLVAQLVLDVDGITAKGYVTFTDLAGSGKTTINGDNITTGTISADRINMTGAISWGDLSQSCKNTIASYAGADGSDADVPSYIHSTYISATEIRSPTIYGATIYAGLRDEGYCKMTASGLNIVSDTGGNICGIGWEPGYYNLPYLTLGQGVDDAHTNAGMIKKYTHGLWIGDNDSYGQSNLQVPTSGTGIFIDFEENKVYKYINGTKTAL